MQPESQGPQFSGRGADFPQEPSPVTQPMDEFSYTWTHTCPATSYTFWQVYFYPIISAEAVSSIPYSFLSGIKLICFVFAVSIATLNYAISMTLSLAAMNHLVTTVTLGAAQE